MKRMKKILLIALLGACNSETKYGPCLGLDDADKRDPTLVYDISVRNAFWSIIGIETIIAPIMWATDYAYCPDGKKL